MSGRSTPDALADPAVLADHAERDLISRGGLDRTLFVEAGAGTGKTSQLVSRVCSLVVGHGVPLADVAAITFTEAAAAELQERIRVRLEAELVAAGEHDDEVTAERCRAALADADRAAITTLHGFARRICAEHAVAAGLPPRVEIVDEITAQLDWADRWSRFVDRLHADPAREQLLLRAAALGIPVEPAYARGTARSFRDAAAQLDQSWDRIEALRGVELDELAPVDLGDLVAAVARVDVEAARCTDPTDRLLCIVREKLVPVRVLLDTDDVLLRLRLLTGIKPIKSGNAGKPPLWGGPEGKAAMTNAVRAVNAAIETARQQAIQPVLEQMLVLTAQEVLDAADRRRAEGRLAFHDLLVIAVGLVRSNAHVRRRLGERFRYLLLDEFQDTDPIQIELAVLIAGTIDDRPPSSWRDVDVPAGRLFFVGDPKQSIYRFRRADIELFLRARERFGVEADRVALTTNFRTVEPIIEWINEFFGTVMAEEVADAQPRYEALHAHRAASPTATHVPVLLGGPHEKGTRAAALRDAEAADVASVLADIRAHPDRWPVYDDDRGDWRDATLGDVTILVPTRTSLPQLRRALDDAHLPYRLATGTLVYASQEIRDLVSAMRVIDDPGDTLALVAALRSPLYACSDVDLFTFRRGGGEFDVRNRPPAGLAEHPVTSALADLAARHEDRWWRSPADLLLALVEDRMAPLLAFAEGDPSDVWRRIRFVVDQARVFEGTGGRGLRAWCDWTELQSADSARVHEPMLPETDDDAVRIMTVHGAKGLEFPITVLSGLTTGPANAKQRLRVLFDGDDPQIRIRNGLSTAMHEPQADLEELMDTHEKRRLLYVALTRARDHLVVSAHHLDGGKECHGRLVWDTVQDFEDRWRVWGGPPASPADVPTLPGTATSPDVERPRHEWIADRSRVLEAAATPPTISATAVAAEIEPRSGRRPPGGVSPPPARPAAVEPGDPAADVAPHATGAAAMGRAVHEVLELVDFTSPELEALAASVARTHAVDAGDVVTLVERALTAPIVRTAGAGRHHRELYVAAPVGPVVLEGYIDLLVDHGDEVTIVDYKTDELAPGLAVTEAADRHRFQGAAYAVAIEAATGRSVRDVRFVFCRARGDVEAGIADLAAAMDEVRRHLEV